VSPRQQRFENPNRQRGGKGPRTFMIKRRIVGPFTNMKRLYVGRSGIGYMKARKAQTLRNSAKRGLFITLPLNFDIAVCKDGVVSIK